MDPIRWLAVPTRMRGKVLKRGLDSYIENARANEKSVSYFVADDATTASGSQETKAVVELVSEQYSVNAVYFGMKERMLLAKNIIARGIVPPDIVKFCLFDGERSGLGTYGAVRNSILLATAGSKIVTVDDDTICRIAYPRGVARGSVPTYLAHDEKYSSSFPCEVRVHRTREELLESLEFEESSFFGMHEEYLGREISDIGVSIPGGVGKAFNEERVLVTINGFAGDCATPSPTTYLLLSDPSFERFLSSGRYEDLILSRQIVRTVTRPTLLNVATNSPGLFAGLDNRGSLPPFMPVGRGEDMVFWEVLAKSRTHAFGMYLPPVLLHAPMEDRRFTSGEVGRSASGISLDVFMSVLLRSIPETSLPKEPDQRLQFIGKHLIEITNQGIDSFFEFADSMATAEMSRYLDVLSRRLPENSTDPWERDFHTFFGRVKEAAQRPDLSVPLDILYNRTNEEAKRVTHLLVRRFGDLLCWWPQIKQCASKSDAVEQVAQTDAA